MHNIRAIAAKIIAQLLLGQGSLSTLLAPHRDHTDYQLLQEICFGSCRWFYSLKPILNGLLSKPLKKKDQDVFALLVIGLYQLRYMRIPDHAVLNETVNATASLGKPWARGLVNAVLRNALRNNDAVEAQTYSDLGRQYAHPAWLVESLAEAWPHQLQSVLNAHNLRAPLTLRVNVQKTDRNTYLAGTGPGRDSRRTWPISPHFHRTGEANGCIGSPWFPGGGSSACKMRLPSWSFPCSICRPDSVVLDACAAPGGKTCHILESEQGLTSMLAIDESALRLKRVRENLDRLGLRADLLAADAMEARSWWDGVLFDRILLDAPCSGTGVIRRHPDIKLLRHQDDIAKLVSQQLDLLTALWPCLTHGGAIALYHLFRVAGGERPPHFILPSTNVRR